MSESLVVGRVAPAAGSNPTPAQEAPRAQGPLEVLLGQLRKRQDELAEEIAELARRLDKLEGELSNG